jgi:hypothetical protein
MKLTNKTKQHKVLWLLQYHSKQDNDDFQKN